MNLPPAADAEGCEDVVCQYGGECRGGQCQCPTGCHSEQQPACGSDGVTYASRCHLLRHACTTAAVNVTLLHVGACRE